MMVPWHTIMIPQYILMGQFHMTDRLVTLILMQAFSALRYFFDAAFFLWACPMNCGKQGKIDGAGIPDFLADHAAPGHTGIATLTIFTFIGQWNDYISPLIYLNSPELYTLQLGLKMFCRAIHHAVRPDHGGNRMRHGADFSGLSHLRGSKSPRGLPLQA